MRSTLEMAEAFKALQKYWNYSNFRKDQKRVIDQLLHGQNVVALLATGGGKSLCYQVPAVLHKGLTIVASPLIALMEDQVQSLKSRGIAAESIHSGLHTNDIDRILDNVLFGAVKILYVSPERLAQERFHSICSRIEIDLVAVDEAHCISQWGHDFRPSYLEIAKFLEQINPCQIIALTATATTRVVTEIQESLLIPDSKIIKASFKRENIAVQIRKVEDKVGEVSKMLASDNQKAIVYVRSRRRVQMIAGILQANRLSATFFHAGLSYKLKKQRQVAFKNGEIRIVVATNAFGMGIDAPDVRRVIHYDIPPSIEEYYQEIGRAGRDGRESQATLLVSDDDFSFKEGRLKTAFPDFEVMKQFYHHLHVVYNITPLEGEGQSRHLDIDQLIDQCNWNYKKVQACLNRWQALGQIEITEDTEPLLLIKMNCSPREARSMERALGKTYNLLSHLMRNFENIFDQWITYHLKSNARGFKVEEDYLLEKLKVLRRHGAIKMLTQEIGSKIYFKNNRLHWQDLDQFRKPYNRLKSLDQDRWQRMRDFIACEGCRMAYILEYFDESNIELCGKCDRCMKPTSSSKIGMTIQDQRRINEA